jgi:hypothetical protein
VVARGGGVGEVECSKVSPITQSKRNALEANQSSICIRITKEQWQVSEKAKYNKMSVEAKFSVIESCERAMAYKSALE